MEINAEKLGVIFRIINFILNVINIIFSLRISEIVDEVCTFSIVIKNNFARKDHLQMWPNTVFEKTTFLVAIMCCFYSSYARY